MSLPVSNFNLQSSSTCLEILPHMGTQMLVMQIHASGCFKLLEEDMAAVPFSGKLCCSTDLLVITVVSISSQNIILAITLFRFVQNLTFFVFSNPSSYFQCCTKCLFPVHTAFVFCYHTFILFYRYHLICF